MANQSTEGFIDNWAYLKTELNWLDRMLMMALARYRQDKKNIDKIAQSPADQASSHWWKGVISLEGKIAYDEHRPGVNLQGNGANAINKSRQPIKAQSKLGYQQQLEQRVQASFKGDVFLALPWLCDRLSLSLFEKNLILMGLAPEVNRRYSRLYRYLQSHDEQIVTDLPSVELVLRLLCHNDQEWRRARTKLAPDAALIRHSLVVLMCQSHEPFLNATVRLSDDLVDCLLAETPNPTGLEQLLVLEDSLAPSISPLSNDSQWPTPELPSVDFSHSISTNGSLIEASIAPTNNSTGPTSEVIQLPSGTNSASMGNVSTSEANIGSANINVGAPLSSHSANTSIQSNQFQSTDIPAPSWSDLVVPPLLLEALQHIGRRLTLHEAIYQTWTTKQPSINPVPPGLVTLFAGPVGTGKSLASGILAHELSSALHCVDLASVMDIDYLQLVDELEADAPTVLLLRSAEQWLCRSSTMPPTRLIQFLTQRRQQVSLTVMTVGQMESVAPSWQQQVDQALIFPLPTDADRQLLWTQSFPAKLNLSRTIDWPTLCQIPLSGGDIQAIAHDAMIRLITDQAKTLKVLHLVGALRWQGVSEHYIQCFVDASGPSRTRKSSRKTMKTQSKLPKSSKSSKSSKSNTLKGSPRKRSNSKKSSEAVSVNDSTSALPTTGERLSMDPPNLPGSTTTPSLNNSKASHHHGTDHEETNHEADSGVNLETDSGASTSQRLEGNTGNASASQSNTTPESLSTTKKKEH